MLIDWFTVGAQVLNFLILVGLLKHFLYQPVLDAIDAREARVAAELADADATRDAARRERDDFQHRNEHFAQERDARLAQVSEEAKTTRQRLLDEARAAADALSAQRQTLLRSEAKSLHASIARRAQDEVFAIARQAFTDLADTSLEARLCAVFIKRLQALDDDARAKLGAALTSTSEAAVVRTAFDLPDRERGRIQHAINETFAADVVLRFQTAPELVSGIELTARGQKVAWSIADYLTTLEMGVSERVQQRAKPSPPTDPAPGRERVKASA